MKKLIFATTAIVSLSATSAVANEISFQQLDTNGIGNLVFSQSQDGGNTINANLKGGMTSVVIEQSGPEGSTSSGNTAEVDIFANSNITLFGVEEEDQKTFEATFDGDGNSLVFSLGTADDADQFNSLDVALAVIGDRNDINHSIANGTSGDSLQFSGSVTGDDNIVLATVGAVGDVALNYDIQGNANTLTATLAGPADGGRSVDVALLGNSNTWTVTSNSSGGVLDVDANGSNITGTNTQGGMGSNLDLDITKVGMSAFTVTTTQSGANGHADVNINAADGGTFTLTQSSANASYVGNLSMSAGSTVTVTQ